MKLFLIRHAQTHLNHERRFQGRGSDDDLSEYGIEQAKKTRDFLSLEKFDIIFSSPQKRAVSTAMIINELHSHDIIIKPELSERDFGAFEGKKYDEVDHEKVYREKLYKEYNIETEEELEERVIEFYNYLFQNYYGKNILVVSHGGILKMLFSKLQDIPWAQGIYEIKTDNASVSIIEIDENKKLKSIILNRNEHLR